MGSIEWPRSQDALLRIRVYVLTKPFKKLNALKNNVKRILPRDYEDHRIESELLRFLRYCSFRTGYKVSLASSFCIHLLDFLLYRPIRFFYVLSFVSRVEMTYCFRAADFDVNRATKRYAHHLDWVEKIGLKRLKLVSIADEFRLGIEQY